MMRAATLIFLLCFFGIGPVSEAKSLVLMIPGAGASGPKIHLHGMGWILDVVGSDDYFHVFEKKLKNEGVFSLVCPVIRDGDTRSLSERAQDCRELLLKHLNPSTDCQGERPVRILGHSMGGLIGRLIAADPKITSCIHSVTSISTPHRGSILVDFMLDSVAQSKDRWWDSYATIVKILGFVKDKKRYLPELRSLRAGYPTKDFGAQDLPMQPGVKYYSFSNSVEKQVWIPLRMTSKILRAELTKHKLDQTDFLTKNDGIIPEYSMVYGEYLGHIEASHWGSACIAFMEKSQECQKTLKAVIPHLISL